MHRFAPPPALQHRLIGPLYVEAMLLADEARACFFPGGKDARESLAPIARVAHSCESLKLTARLMHVTAWLLAERARTATDAPEPAPPARALGPAPETDEEALALLPEDARQLIAASIDLYRRVERLARARDIAAESPARSMLARLSARL